MKIKVLATDVDGTLTNMKHKISVKAIEAIRKLEKKGIPVILASGNALCVLKTLKNYIGCSGALIAEGGGVVEYKDTVKILGKGEEARKALTKLKEKFGDKVEESWTNPYRWVDVALKRTVDKNLILKVIQNFPHLKLLDSGFAYHILDKNVDKGKGLKVAVRLMGFKIKETAVVGDSETDIEMFKVAGLKIALANAPKQLKILANHTTKKSNGEGFTEAVKLILSEKTWLK
ncbi:MAG: phosphoglycolate phosphatase [Candidatus Hecatellales archaeon ex4484_218]|nr:MAG: phosphoglycolate phosphatase [Candidatus Hecatellales archaeon ex4484_218]